jgi:Domain of unknown function (DUF4252)
MKNKIIRLFRILIIIMTLTPLSLTAQTDAISQYFNQYLDDERFTVVYITPKMFQMIAKLDINDKDYNDVKAVLQDLRGLRILQCEEPGLGQQFYKEAIAKFNTKEYELLMTVRDKDENVRFWTKENNGLISELLMLVGEKNEFTMISFIGSIDLSKISKLSNKFKIDGMEHLKDLKDKKD